MTPVCHAVAQQSVGGTPETLRIKNERRQMSSEIVKVVVLIILILSMPAGLIAVVLGLPGTWLILVASVLYGWLTEFAIINAQLLLGLLALAVVAELLDLTAGLWGARRYGGTKKAMVGTMIGGILGAVALSPMLFGVGSIVGAFFGAFAGAFSMTYLEQRKMDEAMRVGWGALLGRVFAMVFKGAAVVIMIGLDIWAIFFAKGA
jgi:uncharacterized protein YqgC (DUF456 family)